MSELNQQDIYEDNFNDNYLSLTYNQIIHYDKIIDQVRSTK